MKKIMVLKGKGYFIGMMLFLNLLGNSCKSQRIETPRRDSFLITPFEDKKFNMRFYPVSLLTGQMSAYCIEFRAVLEYRFKENNSIQFGAAATTFGLNTLFQLFGTFITEKVPYFLYGGRGVIDYRRYFSGRGGKSKLYPFVGAGVSVNGMRTGWVNEGYWGPGSRESPSWTSPYFRANLIMSNYYASGGFQFVLRKRKSQKYSILDLSALV
jgi:hypothetical protein